jgi:hypothetical protein
MPSTAALLRRLSRLAFRFGPDVAATKYELLGRVTKSRLTAAQIRRLHELLCLWQAYPDDEDLLGRVTTALAAFGARPDVRRHKDALENSGIAGTDTVYAFGAPTAQWLAAAFPRQLSIAWDRVDDSARVARHLLLLARAAEVPGYDDPPLADPAAWACRLAGPEPDATFVIRASAAVEADTLVRDAMYNELDLPIRVAASPGSPSRSGRRWDASAVVFRTRPLDDRRPDLRQEIGRAPREVRDVTGKDADRLIHLAHEAMVTRERDLDAFASADPADVRIVEWEDGLQFACLGVQPERRFLLEAVYAFLTLQNGVPIGYALSSALFNSSEIAYNVFETFRGGEAAHVYARLVATVRTLFGADTFAIYPYQLGHENEEGLASGAWWFYYKLGFRPRARSISTLVRREARRVATRPAYRTPRGTLERLVAHPLFFSLGAVRDDVIGVMPLERLGLAVTEALVSRFGSNRADADRVLTGEAAATLGATDVERWSPGERLFWRRWAPLVATLPGVTDWSAPERAALVETIRAKGSRRESDAVTLLTAHAPLRAALRRLMSNSSVPRARRRAGGRVSCTGS